MQVEPDMPMLAWIERHDAVGERLKPWQATLVCRGEAANRLLDFRVQQSGSKRYWRFWWQTIARRMSGQKPSTAIAPDALRKDAIVAARHGIDAFCFSLPTDRSDDGELVRWQAMPGLNLPHCVMLDLAEALRNAVVTSTTVARLLSCINRTDYLRVAGRPLVLLWTSCAEQPVESARQSFAAEIQSRTESPVRWLVVGQVESRPTASKDNSSETSQLALLTLSAAISTERGRRGRNRAHLTAAYRFQAELNELTAKADQQPEHPILILAPWQAIGKIAGFAPHAEQGLALLQALSSTLDNHTRWPVAHELIAAHNRNFQRQQTACVILHLYHEDLVGRMVEDTIAPLREQLDLIVSVRPDVSPETIRRVISACPNSYVVVVENRGRDVRPFLQCLALVDRLGYACACKIHSKKSPHRPDGDAWRDAMVTDLLGSMATAMNCLTQLQQQPDLGLLAPTGALTPIVQPGKHHSNRPWLDRLQPSLSLRSGTPASVDSIDRVFPAGTMFWFKTIALRGLLGHPNFDESTFEPELGQLDGTLAHALERLMAVQVQHAGLRVAEVRQSGQRDKVPATDAT